MGSEFGTGGRFPAAFMNAGSASFTDFLAGYAPGLLPGGAVTGGAAGQASGGLDVPHGTTIVATVCDDGVVMVGDRRATMGNMIAQRDIEKVFRSDDYSCVGIAYRLGCRGARTRPAVPGRTRALRETGRPRADAGRQGQPAGHHGPRQIWRRPWYFVVVPLFADGMTRWPRRAASSVTTRPAGAVTRSICSRGSGPARSSPRARWKKLYREGMPVRDAVLACMQALYDATRRRLGHRRARYGPA